MADYKEAIKECFRTARPGVQHCYFGDPVRDEDSDRVWWIRFGDSMTIGGMTLPLDSVVTACEKHDAMLNTEINGKDSD